jgi:hypothetical protein
MTVPVFAIVGHPNKGKSSIVSTLSQDESVAISPIPGTTVENRRYPMAVDGEILYELIDTPGFQRARAALEWMHRQAGSAVERAATVRRFVDEHQGDPRFTAECRLLTPILEGAGILYVVDGSRSFGEDYEAEMEILRWTGQPSLALINMIGDSDYSEEWKQALGQYFRIVRVFDAMTADFDRRVQLLLAFGEIREEWRPAPHAGGTRDCGNAGAHDHPRTPPQAGTGRGDGCSTRCPAASLQTGSCSHGTALPGRSRTDLQSQGPGAPRTTGTATGR